MNAAVPLRCMYVTPACDVKHRVVGKGILQRAGRSRASYSRRLAANHQVIENRYRHSAVGNSRCAAPLVTNPGCSICTTLIGQTLQATSSDVAPLTSSGDGSAWEGPDLAFVGPTLRREWVRLALGFVGMVGGTCCMVSIPVLGSHFINQIIQNTPYRVAAKTLCVLLSVYVLEPLFSILYVRSVWSVGESIVAGIRRQVFSSLLVQKMEFYDSHKVGELIALLSVETAHLRNLLHNNASRDRGLRSACECLLTLAAMHRLAPKLAPVLGAAVLTLSSLAALFTRSTRGVFAADSASAASLADVGTETLGNIRTVRSFVGEAHAVGRFDAALERCLVTGTAIGATKSTLEVVNRGAIYAGLFALYAGGGFLVSTGQMQTVALLSSIGFCFSLTFSTMGIVNSLIDWNVAAGAWARIRQLLTSSPYDPWLARALSSDQGDNKDDASSDAHGLGTVSQGSIGALAETSYLSRGGNARARDGDARQLADDDARQLAVGGADLRLSAVKFVYPLRPDTYVLGGDEAGLNLTMPGGRVTALVGASGAGKSTIAQLVARLYTPTEGCVMLGHRDISQFSHREWGAAVGMVSQEPVLFAASVADNIAYGWKDSHGSAEDRMRRVEAAAHAANAHEFVSALPEGFDTKVGERGVLLSGGQKQRLAIARAIYKDAPILILDEATSALDSVSEALVQEALERLMANRTTLVIAHRLSTVQKADQIVVLDSGEVLEKGSHDKLMHMEGEYFKLVNPQASVCVLNTTISSA